MKCDLLVRVLALAGLSAVSSAWAAPIVSIAPISQSVVVGDVVSADVTASGLAGDQIGTYDLTLNWDPSLLSFNDVAFDGFLDGPLDSIQGVMVGMSSVNVFELSLGALAAQSGLDSFRLFSLSFTSLGAGTSSLEFSSAATQLIGDAGGLPLDASYRNGRISAERPPVGVPEPGTLMLLAIALSLLPLFRRGDTMAFGFTSRPQVGDRAYN